MSGRLGLYNSFEKASADAFTDVSLEIQGEREGIIRLKTQAAPFDGASTLESDPLFVREESGVGGQDCIMAPSVWDGSDWNLTTVAGRMCTLKAFHQIMTRLTDYTFQAQYATEEIGNINDTLTLKVYDNGVEVVTGWTIDYLTGIVTFTVARASDHVITWEGYYLYQSLSEVLSETRQTFLQFGQVNKLVPLKNPDFELWSGSTLLGWTTIGTSAPVKTAAYIDGAWCAKITADGTEWRGIKQTLTLPTAVSNARLFVVLKTTVNARIGISMDGEVSWTYTETPAETTYPSKYLFLMCDSATYSTTSIVIAIWAQKALTDTGDCEIEGVWLREA